VNKPRQLQVVAGVISDTQGRIFLAQRPDYGGLWEFPGGKREPGESALAALRRELDEELDIAVQQARPLIRIQHEYPDKSILLDVWQVETWRGQPWGKEGQPVAWCPVHELGNLRFLAASEPVVRAVQLPAHYLITPPPDHLPTWLTGLEQALASGARLVQLRAKTLSATQYAVCATAALLRCRAHGARLLLNAEPTQVQQLDADGIHLSSARLYDFQQRPLPTDKQVAASCHTLADLQQAMRIGVDFVVLSPVQITASHPDLPRLGWQRFAQLAEQVRLPVYALGGMRPAHLPIAWAHGAQGIAGISGLWPDKIKMD